MTIKHLSLTALLLAIVAIGGRAYGQSSTSGAIQGQVTDAANGSGLPGVTVVATSTALQGVQDAMTEGNGTYKITNLPPGVYIVTFTFADLKVERHNIAISVNKVTQVSVKLDTSKAGGEKIVITDKAPTIDPTSTTQGTTLDKEYTENIPVPGRDFESALTGAAGSQGDSMGVSFSGSSSLENQYVVDGVNTTSLTYGTVGSPVINEFIKEIEIITGGYQAEYGRATGGVVNVVTQSGTNEFHGSVFTQFANDFLAIDPERVSLQLGSIDTQNNTVYDLSFGATLGGPIIKDKLWFYVGFAPRLISVDTRRITKRLTDCRQNLPGGGLSPCVVDDPNMPGEDTGFQDGEPDEDANGDFIYEDIPGGTRTLNSQQQEYHFVSKLNYAVSPEQQGQLTFSGQPFSNEINDAYGLPQGTHYKYSALGTDLAAKWTSKFNDNKTEIEAVAGWHRDHRSLESEIAGAMDTPYQDLVFGNLGVQSALGYESASTAAYCTDGNSQDAYQFIENCPDLGGGYSVGGIGSVVDDTEERYSARLGGVQRVEAAGTHEIKVGIDVEQNLLNKPRAFTGDRYYQNVIGNSLRNTASYIEEFRWVQVQPQGDPDPRFDEICEEDPDGNPINCDFIGPTDITGNTFNWAAYLRDSWQILPNLTFNAGLRYEEQRMRYAEFIQNTRDPFTGLERGDNALAMKNMWAPRLGASYDWTKEGRSKVYASWGRFFESIPMQINDRSFGGESSLRRIWDAEQCGDLQPGYGAPDGANCGLDGANPANGRELVGAGTLVAPGVKPQYLDEFVVGTEYELFEDLRLALSYQNRRLGRVVEDVSTDGAATYIIANPGEWSSEEETALEEEIMSETDPARKVLLSRALEQFRGIRVFDKPRRDYHALQFIATHRLSRNLFAQATYTYARTIGNFPGLFSPDSGQVDPNISSQYDLIELLANREGPLPQDRPHYFKLHGYYEWDFKKAGKLTTGTAFRAYSGNPVNALAAHYSYGRRESFLLPRGELGRNGAAWFTDIHVGYARDIGRGMELEVFGDVFNIFNRQASLAVDAEYTVDEANPVVGGEYSDLIWLKRQTTAGAETNEVPVRKKNFLNTTARGAPLWVSLGARLKF